MRNTLITICIGILIVALVGLLAERAGLKSKLAEAKKLPSLAEIQEKIGAEPDGIYGPETKKLWDRAICEQEASRWYFGSAWK
jgi:hypothetical protein